ncbi:serine/threonine-protein phosphatase 6 regulatory ankyrin repeat subunit B-like [Scylla paramamosain]|uniref:serine/threonine-protein phosphatase 6 regulatory ankyrin repeat subunit B-like n=1 Tax=Scylla paramamosain TaxID=85552 RepID=UPI003082AA22
MAGSGGTVNIAMAVMQSGAASHIIHIPQPAPVPNDPPTCWEKLQCYMFGPKDNMDLIRAAREGKHEDCKKIMQKGISNINTQDKTTKQTALHTAAYHGKEKLVDLLLSYKAKHNIQDSQGNTPLHLAIKNGHCSCSKRILEYASQKINVANKAHNTPLHLAVKKGYKEIADELLKKSTANINAPDNIKRTALHIAAQQGKEEFVDLLLNHRAKCNIQDSQGNTPLHLAIKNDHCSCSKRILEWNNVNINIVNEEMETPLHIAVSKDYKNIVEKCLEKSTVDSGAQNKKNIETALYNDVSKDYKEIVEKLLEKSTANIDAQNKESKDTALHIAIRMKKDDLVDLLLRYNANCNAQNSKGSTPLHLAIKHIPQRVERILQCKNLQTDLVSEDYNTPLYLAVKKNNMVIVKKLLDMGTANIDAQDKKAKQTALHVAANCGKEEIVEVLLNHNANCNIQDSQGNTPLHLAIIKGHHSCSEKILGGNTANIHLVNENQDSPLHLAVKVGHVTIADKLLDMELDYNAVDSLGNTALHLLAEGGYLDCCKKLLQKDVVNLNAKNDTGDTPLHLATRAGKSNIVTLLQHYPGDCNSQNNSQDTPLHLAVNGGHFNCVTELLRFKNLRIDSTNKDDSTALHCAVKNGNSDIVALLLLHHANCNAKDRLGNTPLHCAVTKGNEACCIKLLECSNLEINEMNTSQEAALHVAARLGRHSMCDLILKHPDKIIDIKDKQEHTPLHLATKENNHEVIKLLLSKGADWRLRDKHSYVPLHYAAAKGYEESCEYLANAVKESGKSYAFKLKNRRTPLILAAMAGHHHCCEMLPLDNIDQQDSFGKTALIYAIEADYENTALFLLRNNAKTDVEILSKKNKANQTKKELKEKKSQIKEHTTILHLAAEKRANKCLECLLKDPNTKELLSRTDENGHTPLHEAINSEALDCAKILLFEGTSPMATTNAGMTPLHLAAKKGDPGLCSLLLSYKVDMNAENNDQETPLHMAAKHGCLDACRALMKKGIRKLAKDKSGRTPLHLAAENGHAQVVQFLIKKGGHPHERDDKDSTALHLAAAKGHLQVCQILVSNARRLVTTMNKEGKLSMDVAFENQKDDVFAFLISKLKPETENGGGPHSAPDNAKKKNMEKRTLFHKYMHQALRPQGQNKPREAAAEGILASEWWTAAFFIEDEEKGHNSDTEDEYSDTQERSPYCTNFHEMINNHPGLALKALDRYHASLSPKSDQNHNFRLFEDNLCSEAGVKHSGRSHAPMTGQRLLQDHPVSLMMKKPEWPNLLQHPFTDSWLMYFWRISVFYIFMLLLFIEVVYLTSLHFFMDNVDNWVQIKHKCNTTQEQFCHLSSSPGKGEDHADAMQGGLLLGKVNTQVDSNFKCSQRTSLVQWQWIFVVVMTIIIAFLECICVYRLRMKYLKWQRLVKISQLIFTFLSWLPIGTCGFQHNVSNGWQWHCGIIGLLLEWILVINMLNQLPVLFVFMPITKRFFFGYIKALLYITLLLFAFSYIFQLLLDDYDAFQSRPLAMIKMIVWLFGDLNYESTFIEKHPLHPDMTMLMFVSFIIIMGGFIANLAVTLPSERLDEFRRDATFFQKLTQSTLLLEIQACFPWFQQQEFKNKADKSKSWMKNLIDKMLQKIFSANIIEETKKDNPLEDLEQQVATLVDMCQEQGREMKELRQQLILLFKLMAEKD